MGWLYATGRTASMRKLRAGRDCGTEIRGCLRGRHRLQKGVSKPQHPTTRGDCRPRSDVQTISPTQATPTSGGFCGSDGPLNGRSRGSGFVGGSSGGSGGVLAMGPTGESSLAGLNLTCMATSMCIGTFWAAQRRLFTMPLAGPGPVQVFRGRKPEETLVLLGRRHAAYVDRRSYFYILGFREVCLIQTA